MRVQPRRALKEPVGDRTARVTGPVVVVGALITTVAFSAWPNPSQATIPVHDIPTVTASPSAVAIPGSEELRGDLAGRADRSQDRVILTAADEKALMTAAALKKAAIEAKKAAAEKRAKELRESIIGTRYTTAALKVRTKPAKDAKSVDVIDSAKKVKVTETVEKGYRQVVVDGKARWVSNEYLSKKKPSAESAAGVSNAACSKSSGIESGLVSNGVKVYRAICAAFPQVTSFGGRRASNDFHGTGQAVDAMISDSAAGLRLANWVRAHASELGVSEVIYAQKIWTVQRSGEGWRGMSDRGSATANHYDHVHVSVY
ncbi:MAG: SH3 domain-containing protein [Microlunatus sp.]